MTAGGGPATVLVLGGTAEGRALAADLAGRPGLRVISSLAGRVSNPALPAGEVRVGGFGGADGLARWADGRGRDRRRRRHPPVRRDDQRPRGRRVRAADLPLLRLARPGWTAQHGDDWRDAASLADAAAMLPALGRRVFLTTGRQGLSAFAGQDRLWFLIRCVDPPAGPLPARHEILLARGPYTVAAELALMRHHAIEVLVTKNSGGSLTEGKLAAARELGLPVVMVRRPAAPALACVATVDEAVSWAIRQARPPAGSSGA